MKEIPLTQGKVALVDDEDYGWLNQWKWCAYKGGNSSYAVRGIKKNGKRTLSKMHREILGTPKGMLTDHRNSNGLDNRRDNLRICNKFQNGMNRGKNDNNKSGYKGVCWHKASKKWRASIHINGKQIHLGLFNANKEAAIIYNEAAIKHFGEFGRLNDIKGDSQ